MRRIKRYGLLFIFIGILIIGLKVYLVQFTSSPQGVVEDFFYAYGRSDLNGMVSCMEPGTEQMVSGATDLAGSLVGILTGVDFDFGALVDLMPFLAEMGFGYMEQIPISDIKVVSYTPAFAPELTDFLIGLMPELVNVMADAAVVSFQIEGIEMQVEVIHYGADGWRIPMDSQLFY